MTDLPLVSKDFLKKVGPMRWILALCLMLPQALQASSLKSILSETPPFQLPKLNYSYEALEPYVDTQTMTIHYTKHHQAYVDNANKLLPESKLTLGEILSKIEDYPVDVRNNVGGHFNHAFFWSILTPNKKDNVVPKKLLKAIEKKFGSFDQFKNEFESAALSRFGSGWVWLIKTENGDLRIVTTPNQDNPLMGNADQKGQPILGVDVWEHAYYLKYQNRRAEYLKQIWSVINWTQVAKYF
jgi:Fe-Mn family superoxide dismutase